MPRALLLTGLLRGAGCEVFIHGGGGGATGVPGGYDKVTERWMQAWLGWTLAPSVVVSATMRLARGGGVVVTPRDVARAVARARRARFSPGLLGQVGAEEEKQRLLGVLADRRGTAAGRRAAFGALRAVQERASADAAESLRAMDAEAARLHEQMEGDRLASDRTWPFPFHGRARLEALSRAIAGAVVEAARGC